MDVKEAIRINERRRKALNSLYNPYTGECCYGERFLLSLSDSPVGDMWLPVEMRELVVVRGLLEAGSMKAHLRMAAKENEELVVDEGVVCDAWIAFNELRMDYDFEYFACAVETIKDKLTSEPIPFILRPGQRKLLAALEDMRQKRIPIRVIIVKARQWGGSTLIQMYMFWIQVRLKKGWNSVICAHLMDPAKRIRAMFENCAERMIPLNGITYKLEPYKQTQNIKQIKERDCQITVGSAIEPDSVRSDDVKMVHFSEAAYYPKTENTNAKQLTTAIVSSVPSIPDTLVAYESTANGVGDLFHIECVKAEAGLSPYSFVFVSWFEIGDLHSVAFNGYYYEHNGRKVEGDEVEFVRGMTDYEKNLFLNNENITLEHLNWYRFKFAELGDDMQKEYPSDWIEAFKDSGEIVFKADDIEALRPGCQKPPIAVGVMMAEAEAASAKLSGKPLKSLVTNVRFIPDAEALSVACSSSIDIKTRERKLNNKLIVWRHPDRNINARNRYLVIYDPAKGISDKADWGSIVVIDRYWRMYGGKSEVVAEWRGHADKDIAVWVAVQIAVYYCNAKLVIESNTFDSEYKKEDDTEFIFETISEFYNNLYGRRTEPDKIKEGAPVRFGFHTNRNTKSAIIANFTAVLRERAYIERSNNTLNQARVYERKKNGAYGAKEGHHDDDLITRMIGLYVDYLEMDMPYVVEESAANKSYSREMTSESVI